MTPPVIEDYFVCVGAQKASTTWLLDLLGGHPEVFATPVKEIHYFDHLAGLTTKLSRDRRRSRFRKYLQRCALDWRRAAKYRAEWPWWRAYLRDPVDDSWYAELFRHRGPARLAGEATPHYALIGAAGFAHLRRLAPDARVLYVLRDPVDQAWSQYRHHRGKTAAKRAGLPLDDPKHFLALEMNAGHRAYAPIIDRLTEAFGPERLKVLFHEDIHADPTAALAGICGFLGLAYDPRHFADPARRRNPSRPWDLPPELRAELARDHRATVEAVEARLGRVPECWRGDGIQ